MLSVVAFEVIQVVQIVNMSNHRFILEFWFFINGTAAEPSPVRVMNTFMEMTGSPDPAKVMQMLQSMGPEDQDVDTIERIGGCSQFFLFCYRTKGLDFGNSIMGIWCAQVISVQERIMEHAMNLMNGGVEKSPAEERAQFRKDREKFKAHHQTNIHIDPPQL